MFRKIVLAISATLLVNAANAQNPLLGEVELKADSRTERDAGVWLDGQYVGFVSDLRGGDRLVLVPGRHDLLIKLVGYEDLRSTITVEPGEKSEYRVALQQKAGVTYPAKEGTARVRVEIEPEDAAIFVNETFVGHVDRFDGRRGLRMEPGTYRFTIALPGFEAFQTQLTLRADQTYEVKTRLKEGRLSDQAAELFVNNPGVMPTAD